MKNNKYYVIELSFRKSNPIHRAICFHRSKGNIELSGFYEDKISTHTSNLAYFKVVEEITSMHEQFDNQNKLPTLPPEKQPRN